MIVHPRRLVKLTNMFFNCLANFHRRCGEGEFVFAILCDSSPFFRKDCLELFPMFFDATSSRLRGF